MIYQHRILGPWTKYLDNVLDLTNPHAEALWKTVSLSLLQRCFAPGCVRSYQGERRKFARCGACRVVPYCSVECQRVAFSHTEAPHRRVCGHIWVMVELGSRHGFLPKEINMEVLHRLVTSVKSVVTLKACQRILAYDDYIQAAYIQAISKPSRHAFSM
jgi:hypothetical protein